MPRVTDCLIVVDVQNDFCPGGALEVQRGDEIVPLVNRLAREFENVVVTQDWHPAGHASFASSHAGKKPFETTRLRYGKQVLWPTTASRERAARRCMTASTCRARNSSSARDGTRRSTATLRSSKPTARRKPGSTATCGRGA
jgi:hypothetical protein